MKVTRCSIALGISSLILLVMCIQMYLSSRSSDVRVVALQNELSDLAEKEKKSVIVKHISKQMEEIAYQQKEISEKQREEAITQTRIAMEMRQSAEEERENALNAESRAVQALNLAESQRTLAEEQRLQAEFAKRMADTLAYVALGRSLGSLSAIQFKAGNEDLASLLAYAAWTFTTRYKGDIFLPAIFNALSGSSHSMVSWTDHKGAVVGIASLPASPDAFVTISKYGAIIRWKSLNGKFQRQILFCNSNYDFRDVYIDGKNTIYALSYNGHLLIIQDGAKPQDIVLESGKMQHICAMHNGECLMMVSNDALIPFWPNNCKVGSRRVLSASIASVGYKGGDVLLFGVTGEAFYMSDSGSLTAFTIPIDGKVTAYAWCPSLMLSAYGMDNGDIYLVDETGRGVRALVGHRSAITELEFSGTSLLSSSYDCTVNLWNVQMQKIEPVTLRTFSSWVHCLNASLQDGYLWVGEESGTLSRISVSPSDMAHTIRAYMKRDFSMQEWNHYIGTSIPFESYIRKVE